MAKRLHDVTGFRGERIVELCLTQFASFPKPLFAPGFLGDKWPAIDFYVELTSVKNTRPYFFAQVRATRASPNSKSLKVDVRKKDVARLLKIPGPTYVFGVHEPTQKVFVRSIHLGMASYSVGSIPLQHELTSDKLVLLQDEVRALWESTAHKPSTSVFT